VEVLQTHLKGRGVFGALPWPARKRINRKRRVEYKGVVAQLCNSGGRKLTGAKGEFRSEVVSVGEEWEGKAFERGRT